MPRVGTIPARGVLVSQGPIVTLIHSTSAAPRHPRGRAVARLAILSLAAFGSPAAHGGSGIFDAYTIVNTGGGNAFYEYGFGFSSTQFAGTNFGSYIPTGAALASTFRLNGGQIKTYKNGGSDVFGADLNYRVFQTAGTAGSFSNLSLAFGENYSNPGDQRWETSNANIDLTLAGTGVARDVGTYSFQVYGHSNNSDGGATVNNGGNYYTATFAIGVGQFAFTGSGGSTATPSNYSLGIAAGNGHGLVFAPSSGTAAVTNSLNSANALTFASGATSITGNALTLAAGIVNNGSSTQNVGMPLTLSAAQSFNSASGDLNVSGQIANGGNRLSVAGTHTVTLAGGITGTGDLLKQGSGTLRLAGAAPSFGPNSAAASNLYVDNGTVEVSANNALGTTDQLTTGIISLGTTASSPSGGNGSTSLLISAPGVSILNPVNARNSPTNFTKTIGGTNSSGVVTFSGKITLNDSLTLTAATGGNVLISGSIAPATSGLNGVPGLFKVGGGEVSLSGGLSYGGATQIDAGRLNVNGNHVGGSSYSINNNGVLGGGVGGVGGAIDASTLNINAGGTLGAGDSTHAGRLSLAATAFNISSSSTFTFKIGGTSPGTGYDQLSTTASGTVLNINGAMLALSSLNNYFTTIGQGAYQGGQKFTLIQRPGTSTANKVVGTFASALTPLLEGASFDAANTRFQISYAGGDGNDVEITTVPEPASGMLLTSALLAGLARRRYRQVR